MIETLRSIDPATGETVWEGLAASREHVEQAVASAREAFPGWASVPLAKRIAHVRGFKDVLESRSGAIAEIISRETGKALWESRAELASMVAKVETSIAAHAERAGERGKDMPFGRAVLRHRPHGVMAVLGPFNFPGHLPNGHIVPALLAGNTIVFKPSELTPATGEAMAESWAAAGVPDGVFNVLQGGHETGDALVKADMDGLLFTGSASTGAHFRRVFADRPNVILALELGGNNPLVIWDGATDEAAAIAAESAFVTTGQRCSCARRLIVPDTLFGTEIVDAMARLADRLIIGAWNEIPEPFMGPLVSADAAMRARAQFDALVAKGAKTIRPLQQPDGKGEAFVTAAMLDVTHVEVPDEEIFAPLLQVTRVPDFDAALAQANATAFGLSAGLISEDEPLWQRFRHEVRAGIVNRNRPTTGASGAMPFGGLGNSGNFRPGGYYAADYCAYPAASFEASSAAGALDAIERRLRR